MNKAIVYFKNGSKLVVDDFDFNDFLYSIKNKKIDNKNSYIITNNLFVDFNFNEVSAIYECKIEELYISEE